MTPDASIDELVVVDGTTNQQTQKAFQQNCPSLNVLSEAPN